MNWQHLALIGAIVLVLWLASQNLAAADLNVQGLDSIPDVVKKATFGNLNNNPLNVKPPPGTTWNGQIGVDYRGLCQFDTLSNGVRAGCINIVSQFRENDALSLQAFGEKYAPAGVENNNPEYGFDLASQLGVPQSQPYDWMAPGAVTKLALAVAQNEEGQASKLLLSPFMQNSVDLAFAHFGINQDVQSA